MVLRSRAVCGALLMAVAVSLLWCCWGDWRYIDQPYPIGDGYTKYRRASEVWAILAAVLFLTATSGTMLWTALQGRPMRLSSRVQILVIMGLVTLWLACLVAAFTFVNEVDALAPAILLMIGLCPVCILVLLARLRRKAKA